jgi:spermidine synthase
MSFVLFLFYFCLGSRRRVAVGGVGDGETESISLGL